MTLLFDKLYNEIIKNLVDLIKVFDIYYFEDNITHKSQMDSWISEVNQNRNRAASIVKDAEKILADTKTSAAKIAVEHYKRFLAKKVAIFQFSLGLVTALLVTSSTYCNWHMVFTRNPARCFGG
ncbi:MAG: hypothetical protein IPK76_09730 [Lewinellaceae bacterium]|nr:hypothetical protein [Lewinellaceae bacterium]